MLKFSARFLRVKQHNQWRRESARHSVENKHCGKKAGDHVFSRMSRKNFKTEHVIGYMPNMTLVGINPCAGLPAKASAPIEPSAPSAPISLKPHISNAHPTAYAYNVEVTIFS